MFLKESFGDISGMAPANQHFSEKYMKEKRQDHLVIITDDPSECFNAHRRFAKTDSMEQLKGAEPYSNLWLHRCLGEIAVECEIYCDAIAGGRSINGEVLLHGEDLEDSDRVRI